MAMFSLAHKAIGIFDLTVPAFYSACYPFVNSILLLLLLTEKVYLVLGEHNLTRWRDLESDE
jgi:hypothetical protein